MKNFVTGLCMLLVWYAVGVQANEGQAKCAQGEIQNLGLAFYDEILIDKPVEEVWPEILNYTKWQVGHTDATHITIEGEPREVGEIVKIIKTHKDAIPYYAETVRLRENKNVVWRVFSGQAAPCTDTMGTSAYMEFRTESENGKTLFVTSYYASFPVFGEALENLRKQQLQGKEGADFIREGSIAFKKYMESL